MSDRLPITKRWEEDAKQGAVVVYACHMCEHRGEKLNCKIYGKIPTEIAEGKQTCKKHKAGEIDFGKITL